MNILERLRRETGMRQVEYANRIGISARTLSLYENNKGIENINLITVKKICEISNITIDEFIKEWGY